MDLSQGAQVSLALERVRSESSSSACARRQLGSGGGDRGDTAAFEG